MISSISPKDLLHDWNGKALKKEGLMYFDQEDHQDFAKKMQQKDDLKKEMSLPKTKLTKKGQLYLYTDGLSEESKVITNKLNKNLMQKAYSKKWIDDISDLNLNLNPLNLLSDSFEENVSFVSSASSKKPAGRSNDYFINNLRKSKTGKDRYTSKTRYQEFLPVDFNSKSELDDAIKQLNDSASASRRNTAISLRNSQLQSRLTRTSTFSLLQEYELSSDEEKFEAFTSENMGLSKATSRLSSQPVLSSKQLIDNLNFKLNSGFLIPGTNKKLDDFDDQKKLEESIESNLSGIHYKNTYQLEENDLNLQSQQSDAIQPTPQSKSATERRDSEGSTKLETENLNRKILNKRNNKSNLNKQLNQTENTETIAIKKIPSNANANAILSPSKSAPNRRSRKSSISTNKRPISPRMNTNNSGDSSGNLTESKIDLLVLGPKRFTEADNYLDASNMSARTPHRTSFASHVSLQTPINQINFTQGQTNHTENSNINNSIYINESFNQDLAPITISVTKIDHELTGNSIKVRRFFDRQTMRIKRMPLYDSKTNTRIEDPNNNAYIHMHGKQIAHMHSEDENEVKNLNNMSKTTIDPPFSTPDINLDFSRKESLKNSVYDSDTENRVENNLSNHEDDLNSKIKINSIDKVLDNSQQPYIDAELQTHEYLADLNQIENEKAYLNSDIKNDPRTTKELKSPIRVKNTKETSNSARSSFESSTKIKLGERKQPHENSKSSNDDEELAEVKPALSRRIDQDDDVIQKDLDNDVIMNKFQRAKKEAEKELENEINEINQMSEEEMSKMYMPSIAVKPLLENQNSNEHTTQNMTESARNLKDKDQLKVKPIKNPPTIRKFSLTSLNDKLDLKTLEDNLKTDFRITSANINRKSATSSTSNRDSTRKPSKSSQSNGGSQYLSSNNASKANLNENDEVNDYQMEDNEMNIDNIPSEPVSIANDYYYITLKNQINFLNENNDYENIDENKGDDQETSSNAQTKKNKDVEKKEPKKSEFDDEENLSTFKIIVKKKTDENSFNDNVQSDNEESHYTEIKINKFLTNSEIDEFEMKNEMEKLKEDESKNADKNKQLELEVEEEINDENNLLPVNQNNQEIESKTTGIPREIVNEIKSEISRENLVEIKKLDDKNNKLSETASSTNAKSNEDIEKFKEEKEAAYSNENSNEIELVESKKKSEENLNSSLTTQQEPKQQIETKTEPMNKSGKRVEFSNRVTEQIIPADTVEGTDEIKQDPIVKEVDFDIKFLDKPSETPNEVVKKNITSSPTKSAKTPGSATATNNKANAKSSSKSPPPATKTKSAPSGTKGGKTSGKEKSSTKDSTKDSIIIETPVKEVEEISLPVEEPKTTVDPLAKFNELLGIKEDKQPEKPKVVAPKKAPYLPRYPYLQIPWDTENAIVDVDAYRQTFMIPDVLVPQLHKMDAKSISVEELLLERRILEEKIIELRTAKLNAIHGVSSEKTKKSEKKNLSKKAQKDQMKTQKEAEMKDSIIRDERTRLHNEAMRSHGARDAIGNLLSESIKEKETELQILNSELETNTQEFETQLNSVVNQIKYLETSEDEVREMIGKNRAEFRDQWNKRQMDLRQSMKARHEDRKETRMFDFNVKREELEWLLKMYNDPVEIEKINAQQAQLNIQMDVWLTEFENKAAEEEKDFDEKEEKEDNRLTLLEQEEEENSLVSLKQEQFEMLQAKKTLVENFEEMKNKILNRIQLVTDEKMSVEAEKKAFDESTAKITEQQEKNLTEIFKAEQEARQQIKNDLDIYRIGLMKTREKNLSMKSNLTFLRHCHAITKPYVFSYGQHWSIESFSRPFNQDKRKSSKPKK